MAGPFAVVSTGFVSKDKLREYFSDWPRFIALTCSSSIPEDEDVALVKKTQANRDFCGGWGHGIPGVGGLSHMVEQTVEIVRKILFKPLREEIDRLGQQVSRLEEEIDRLHKESNRREK